MTQLFLHGFGTRYDLPAPLVLYLFVGGFVVVVSFVLVALFAGDRLGERAVRYPRRRARLLDPLVNSRAVRIAGRALGLAWLLAVIVTGFFGSPTAYYNPAEYLVWVYFWALLVVLSGAVGNLWDWVNPWIPLHAALDRLSPSPLKPRPLPKRLGIWPAVALYFLFAYLELASGVAAFPAAIAAVALAYSVLTVAGMLVFGRDPWLSHAEPFTLLFGIVGRFAPIETDKDRRSRQQAVYLRPWGVGLLRDEPASWDWIVFVILMLSTLAFDGLLATPFWRAIQPFFYKLGGQAPGRTIALIALTGTFLLAFVLVMRLVMWFGWPEGLDRQPVLRTMGAFAFTLVPIALVYNAAHNYTYITIQAQLLIPLLADPLQKGWHLLPLSPAAGYRPNFAIASPAIVWYAQVVLIVLGHVIAVYLAHLRAGERFKRAVQVLQSQYPMLALMVLYTITSLWILAQPVTKEV